MLNIVNSIYNKSIVRDIKKATYIPKAVGAIHNLIKLKPVSRLELVTMGYKQSTIDQVIRILYADELIEKTYDTNDKGHRKQVIYNVAKEI